MERLRSETFGGGRLMVFRFYPSLGAARTPRLVVTRESDNKKVVHQPHMDNSSEISEK